MRIDSAIKSYLSPHEDPNSRSNKRIHSADKAPKKKSRDRVELSVESQDQIARVKARIQSGYYNSSEVTDDISEKLGKYFDEVLRDI